MKRILFVVITFSLLTISVFAKAESVLRQPITVNGIRLQTIKAVPEEKLAHVQRLIKALLSKDTKGEGRIRKALAENQATILILPSSSASMHFNQSQPPSKTPSALVSLPLDDIRIPGRSTQSSDAGDATLAVVTHLIHNYGIKPAYPQWQNQLMQAMQKAIARKAYRPRIRKRDMARGEFDDQYFTLGVEVYYGIWQNQQTADHGALRYPTRAILQRQDPKLFALIEQVLPQQLS